MERTHYNKIIPIRPTWSARRAGRARGGRGPGRLVGLRLFWPPGP